MDGLFKPKTKNQQTDPDFKLGFFISLDTFEPKGVELADFFLHHFEVVNSRDVFPVKLIHLPLEIKKMMRKPFLKTDPVLI